MKLVEPWSPRISKDSLLHPTSTHHKKLSWSVPSAGYTANEALIDVLTCNTVTADGSGGVSAQSAGGMPQVLVPASAHVSRLVAARFQLDLLRSTMLLVARTDAESAKLLSSTVDVLDHAFVRGVAAPDRALAEVIAEAEAAGRSGKEIDALEADWLARNPLCTFNEGGSRTCALLRIC